MSSHVETTDCVLCDALRAREEEGSLVVHVGRHNFIVMNLYPYNSGHLMVAPRRHVESLQDTGREVLAEMMGQIRLAEKVLQAQYRPKGFNIGMNLGKAAGAGIPGHIHMHIVPRWDGDTNFMTVLGEVRVLPEDLGEAARSLRKRFASEAGVLTSP